MTAREVLDGIRAELDKITEGPWQHEPYGGQNQNGDYAGGYIIDGHGEWLISDVSDSDGPFIASAPSTVARLSSAVEAVLALVHDDTLADGLVRHVINPDAIRAAIENALKESQ